MTVPKCLESTGRTPSWQRAAEESLPELGCPGEQLGVGKAWAALVLREPICFGSVARAQGFNGCKKYCFLWFEWGLARTRLSGACFTNCIGLTFRFQSNLRLCHSPSVHVSKSPQRRHSGSGFRSLVEGVLQRTFHGIYVHIPTRRGCFVM